MKIEKGNKIFYVVHAISILDLDLLNRILRPLADSVTDKIDIAQYIFDLERIIRDELDTRDTYLEVVHGLCKKEGCPHYRYTFTSNYTRVNFTLEFEETYNGMLLIKDCNDTTNEKQIRYSSFKGKDIDIPF